MTTLITGRDGFIGGYLCNYLKERGESVVSTTADQVDLANRQELFEYLRIVDDTSCIIHCATSARDARFEYRDDAVQNNVGMLINLLEYSRRRGILLVVLGSGSDVDRNQWCDHMDEEMYIDHPPPCSDIHGTSKNMIAMILNNCDYNRVMMLRLFGVFGIGEDYLSRLIPNTAAKCLTLVEPVLYQDRRYDYIDVDDLGRFIAGCIENDRTKPWISSGRHKDFNFCRGNTTSILEIVTYIRDEVNSALEIRLIKKGIGRAYGGSSIRLRNEFAWFEFSTIVKGLDAQIRYWSENRSLINVEALRNDTYLTYASKIASKL